MTGKARFKSDGLKADHSAARGLRWAGTIDQATMRGFDQTCLAAPPVFGPLRIKRIREHAHVSQPARYLNTSECTVQKWEAGPKRPSGMAFKLLAVVEKHGLKVIA
jgi:putative transcriptional regulator